MRTLFIRNLFLSATLALGTPAILSSPAYASAAKTPAAKATTIVKQPVKPIQVAFACNDRNTDLQESINNRDIAKLQTCLEQGVDVNAQQGDAFASASLRGETDMVKAMLPYMNDVAALERSLAVAALRGHEGIVDAILSNPNVKLDMNKPGARYLAYAARAGQIDIMRKFVTAGARDDDGFALASAINAEKKESFDYLLQEARISPDAGNGMVLSMAIMSGDKHYVSSLLEKGAKTKFFPIVAQSLADIRKLRESGTPDAEQFKKPVYDEIIAMIEAALDKPEAGITDITQAKPAVPSPS